MTTGRPIQTKCPSCMLGKYGKDRAKRGCVVDAEGAGTPIRHKWIAAGRRRGRVYKKQTRMICLDCGHVWWSTLGL